MDPQAVMQQLEFVQSTNQLLMKNQAMLQEMMQTSRNAYEKTILELRQQIQVFSQAREQDRKTLNSLQMARQQDINKASQDVEALGKQIKQLKQELEDFKESIADPKL
jgi:predicted translin family RNA/ssDNA-binding protein